MEWKTTYDINAASPIVIDDSVFISSGLAHGCALLNIGKKLEVQWEAKSMTNKMSGCVRIGDCLYGVSERGLMCISLDDGSMKWLDRSTKDGALTAAGDRLIVLTEKGELVIGKASPDGFEPTARKQVLEGGVCWTTPVISKGRIYCRNSLGELVCRDNN